MTVENLEKELKQEKLHSIYLFYGEETYLLENAVKKIKKIFGDLILGINYIQINETNANGLISDIETPAFGYDKKLIIVKNSGILKKEKKSNTKSNTDLQKKISEYIKENIMSTQEKKSNNNIETEVNNDLNKQSIIIVANDNECLLLEKKIYLKIKKKLDNLNQKIKQIESEEYLISKYADDKNLYNKANKLKYMI